jgi:DNA repair protein RadC
MLQALKPPSTTLPKAAITTWAEENRPREKMLMYGNDALSDAELIALLIGSGTVDVNAVELAQQILLSVNGNLSELGRRSVKDLMKFKGIGEAKAITIAAALEFGRRRQFSDVVKHEEIKEAKDVFALMLPILIDLPYEEFWVLLLNQASHVVGKHRISTGGVTGITVDAKMVFRPAIEALACSLILVHNHPSGQLIPSAKDKELTNKLRIGGKALDINVADHVIIARSGFFSFSEAELLK